MSISNSIRVLFMILFVVCLNLQSLVSANSDSNGSIDINVIGISIENDLPPGSAKLFFYDDFEGQDVEIRPGNGNAYVKLLNVENQSGGFKWNRQCATFSLIPGNEKGHQRIFWSVRADGVYHSWNSKTWDKREHWVPC